jgi:hypothetical protein
MNAPTTHSNNTTNSHTGVPPVPPEAHQKAGASGYAGQTRVVVMNGSRIYMKHDGEQWWNWKVERA